MMGAPVFALMGYAAASHDIPRGFALPQFGTARAKSYRLGVYFGNGGETRQSQPPHPGGVRGTASLLATAQPRKGRRRDRSGNAPDRYTLFLPSIFYQRITLGQSGDS